MKAKDITPGDYEVKMWGSKTRATVLAVGPKTRRVYSGARWDIAGHTSTSTVVTVKRTDGGREYDITPQQVLRPWSEAQPDYERKEAERQHLADVVAGLCAQGLPAYAGERGSIHVILDVVQASDLLDRLSR